MFTKPYLCPRCRKRTKSINELIRYLNACKSHIYPRTLQEIQQEYYKEDDVLGRNQKDKVDLKSEIDYIATTNDSFEMLTKDTPQKELLASEFLSTLREKQFSSHEFPASTFISNKKYKYSGSKYKSIFYFFNDHFDYTLAYYFAELETTKGNVNKFSTD